MKLQLTGLKNLTLDSSNISENQASSHLKKIDVLYCAICKTDAKMWNEGHRDLIFPRVLGHEFVGQDKAGKRYAIWPGQSCGNCFYCQTGRENLCEEMKIIGFHSDGGFSDQAWVPKESLVEIPDNLASHLACFAEPVGCVLNALDKVNLKKNERIIIYGGGTLGLITALIALKKGACPLVIEKDEKKISKSTLFLEKTGIQCLKDTTDSKFDVAINTCPDLIAFSLCFTKLRKGGRFSFFSGLKKNEMIESNLLNLIHYKEYEVFGGYGLKRIDIEKALPYIQQASSIFETLIEEIIQPEQLSGLMPTVLSGDNFRYLLQWSKIQKDNSYTVDSKKNVQSHSFSTPPLGISELIDQTLLTIQPLSEELLPAIQSKIDNKTKPLGSLGNLENLGIQLSQIQSSLFPKIDRKLMLTFAADHGITEEGVSAFPSEVTYQMVENCLQGGAAISVLCQHYGIDFKVIDIGVKGDIINHSDLIHKKIRESTRNFALEPAMKRTECTAAIEAGIAVFKEEYQKSPVDILGLGEIGIGNTTSAAAIICAITGISPADATGRGTGIDNQGLKHKIEVIEKSLQYHQLSPNDGLDILEKIGGFELAGIVGAIFGAASQKIPIVLDGVICTAAGLIAYLIKPDIKGFLISGHKSVEKAQKSALSYMGLVPMLDLNMRLGEGTGAAICIGLADTACSIMRNMASFEEAAVSNRKIPIG